MPSICLDGPTEKYVFIIPRTKSECPLNTRKSLQHLKHLRTAMARTGQYEEGARYKAVVGANCPRVQRRIKRMRVIMTAANCSPAVASCRAKYNDDFRILTLLGAQPLDAKYRHGSRT
jgi:hypothetical protein